MKKFLFAFLIIFLSVGKSWAPVDPIDGGTILDCGACPGGGTLNPIMPGCQSGYAESAGCDSDGYEYITCDTCLSGYTRTRDDSTSCLVFYCEGAPLCFGTHTTENVAFTDAYGSGYTVTFRYLSECNCNGIQ